MVLSSSKIHRFMGNHRVYKEIHLAAKENESLMLMISPCVEPELWADLVKLDYY